MMKLVSIYVPTKASPSDHLYRNPKVDPLLYAKWAVYHCYTLGEAPYVPLCLFLGEPGFLSVDSAWSMLADVFAFYVDLDWSGDMRDAHERMHGENEIEIRTLPPEMREAFERGEKP